MSLIDLEKIILLSMLIIHKKKKACTSVLAPASIRLAWVITKFKHDIKFAMSQ